MRCVSFLMWFVRCGLCRDTVRHLHQRIAEHKYSAIGRHFVKAQSSDHLLKENQFRVLRKCQGKFDCLVFKMLFTKNLKPNLKIHADGLHTCPTFCLITIVLFLRYSFFITHCYFGIYRLQLTNIRLT